MQPTMTDPERQPWPKTRCRGSGYNLRFRCIAIARDSASLVTGTTGLRYAAIILSGLLLAGCPAEHRLYIHNKSDDTLSSAYLNPNWKAVTIRPGRTKYVSLWFGEESCFSLFVEQTKKAFHIPTKIMMESRSTGYGGRLDVYYEYDKLHFRFDDGHWIQLQEIDGCNDI